MCLAMLPVLENAQQTLLTAKQLETENCRLKAAIEQHESDTERQGNTLHYISIQHHLYFLMLPASDGECI